MTVKKIEYTVEELEEFERGTSKIIDIEEEKKPPEKPRDIVNIKTGSKIQPLMPTTLDEVYRFAKMMVMTGNLSDVYYKEPDSKVTKFLSANIVDIATSRAVHAIQLGMEVGLPPAQSLQSIYVMKGIGTIWGDAQLALVRNSGICEYVKEYTIGEMWQSYDDIKKEGIVNRDYAWVCETHRKGEDEPVIRKFTIRDAIHAGIWGKNVWATHPNRMGMYKVRAFCLRDTYADVLKGLTHSVEEMQGEMVDVTPHGNETTPDNSGAILSALLESKPAMTIPVMKTEQEKVTV